MIKLYFNISITSAAYHTKLQFRHQEAVDKTVRLATGHVSQNPTVLSLFLCAKSWSTCYHD